MAVTNPRPRLRLRPDFGLTPGALTLARQAAADDAPQR